MTHILHLGAGNLFGGVEVNLVTLARVRHARPDLSAEYAFCFDAKPAAELRAQGVPVHILGAARFRRPWTALAARRRLAALLREAAFHHVICHETWVHALFAAVIRRAGVGLVFWAHDRHDRPRGLIEQMARRVVPDRVICNSHYSAAGVAGFFPGAPWDVVYCPVLPLPAPDSPAARTEFRRGADTNPDAVVVLQVGRWERHKGHMAHVAALGRLRDLPRWTCWFVGAPQRPAEREYEDEVRALARQQGIAERVRFLGWQSDLGRVLHAADIYCQPNARPEPFGIAIVEALHAGLPVIASSEAGPREIVTADVGVLVPPGDVTALAAALRRLIEDPPGRSALGRAGEARARSICDPVRQIGRLADCLIPCCGSRRTIRRV